ncbi:YceI family protein [Lysinibacillus sp. KU-BSD001]|uniref:YceI family protein n=1 Tax=Lysinibacillus sp. KU-BSD001 TaxID=3141328 RepID=UPI0036E0AD73
MAHFTVDMAHSEIGFSVRHMKISKVKGTFGSYTAKIEAPTIQELHASKIEIEIDVASISTRDLARDQHLISADFFDADRFPKIYFTKTDLIPSDEELYTLTGDLTIKNVTKSVTFDVLYKEKKQTEWNTETHVFTCSTVINRKDFGLTYNALIEANGTIIDENIQITVLVALNSY